eukprot:TRINITY_DN3901_c0_g1_i2.p1 TRINITY_DN3901_c0_g1~~TRINITY_DN3901_c0_g1_i2.p1  ORF type:complete len:184 (-),score=2.53 TRINITY_DN3901_c0_g1_i2:162-713(-)
MLKLLKLKLNSINCCRNDHPPHSNLRDYIPSKTLHIPGDGNCLFSSLAYYMTGNIDTCNRIRTLIVDNMVGKLKGACNKFIMNKYPRTVINYRNVNDYVVKSKMRTNGTWGTDVELFAVALLLQTDIWIHSKDVGNKWMFFSGRGVNLNDALASPPANPAGSIYLCHNGVHYEPILGVEKNVS